MCRRLILFVVYYLISGLTILLVSAQNRPRFLSLSRSQPPADHRNHLSLQFIGDRLTSTFSGARRILDVFDKFTVMSTERPATFQNHDNSLPYNRPDERTRCWSSSKVNCHVQEERHSIHNLKKQDLFNKPLNKFDLPATTTTEVLFDSTTGEYETTTYGYEDLNRIANPSHVVASLIG